MSLGSNEMSAADIAAITGNNNDGFGGGNGAWWIIILFLFAFCGWGGGYANGGGFGGGGSGYISDNYALISDNATLERKIDGVYAGICDSTFALNNTANNGFAAAQNTMTQGFAGLNTALVTQGYETRNAIQGAQITDMQSFNALQAQLAQCCCDNKAAVADLKYSGAMNTNTLQNSVNQGFCQTNFNAQSNTRDIIDSQNANTRAILDAIQSNKVEALKDRIAEQNQQISALNLAASQVAQNEYLINRLQPTPVPAFPASKLYGYCGCNSCGCNC